MYRNSISGFGVWCSFMTITPSELRAVALTFDVSSTSRRSVGQRRERLRAPQRFGGVSGAVLSQR
jgi:hypothetical protein